MLTVKTANGQTVQVTTGPSTTYDTQAPATASDVKAGATVKVQLDVTGGFSINPQVHGAPGAGFVVTWAQYNGADYDVRARLFDGHFADYADFLVSDSRKQNEYAKSKGWIKAYYILSNNNNRKDEPDLYLVTVSDRMATPAEQIARNKEMNAYLKSDDRKQLAGSGQRATYRHITGDMLLQQLVMAH